MKYKLKKKMNLQFNKINQSKQSYEIKFSIIYYSYFMKFKIMQ